MSGPNCFFDTNIFLRIVAKDDPIKLADCERLIERVKQGRLKAVTSGLVMAEVVWTCQRTYGLYKHEILEVLQSIKSIANLQFADKQKPWIAADLFKARKVKFIDCLIASQPQILNGKIKVVSYDKDFDKLGVRRVEPSDLI